mmetsp:Transcript_42703/g.65548  ORF Transcript_42703/g.65548 Transcript_42703/m.65548 type:complete len:307 (+) Transcript_42703:68-988(+)
MEPFTLKQLFQLANFDKEDEITATCASLNGLHLALGTLKGKLFLINRLTGQLEQQFHPHAKRISCIHIREGNSVLTSSNDGTIHIQPLKKGVQAKRIDLKDQYEISCFCPVDPMSDTELIVGFGKGDIMYYKEGQNLLFQATTTRKNLYKEGNEGSILSVMFYRKIMVWATAKMVRIRYYPSFEEGRNVCSIEAPTTRSEKLPEYLQNTSTVVRPNIIFMRSRQKIHDPHPNNITMITSWFNMVKLTELIYDPAKDKFIPSQQARKSILLDHSFIAGNSLFEVEGNKAKYLHLQFNYEKTEAGVKV